MSRTILAQRIAEVIERNRRPMRIKEIAQYIPDKPETTIRGRLYTNLEKRFRRIAKGVYTLLTDEGAAFVLENDGRDLSVFDDDSVDAIITDHPWEDDNANKGRNRSFDDSYRDTSFRYTLEDFKEKARVLKPGGFLVEILPAENETNFKYLYELKIMAEEAGLSYYSKVAWKKGDCIFNTGRKSKNSEDVIFFVKGRARSLRPDKQRDGFMSGTAYMLPTEFDYQPASPRKRIHQAEKPVELYEAILEAVTLPGEIVVDQFAGSGNLGVAAIRSGRIGVLFEILRENVNKIIDNLCATEIPLFV